MAKRVIDDAASDDTVPEDFSASFCFFKEEPKTVRFSDNLDIQEVASPSSEEVNDRWLSGKEYFKIKKEGMAAAHKMSQSSIMFEDDDHFCTRGLSLLDKRLLRDRKRTIMAAITAVLTEQELSEDQGLPPDHELIAESYKECNERSVQHAIELANHDAEQARSYLADTRTFWTTQNRKPRKNTRGNKFVKNMVGGFLANVKRTPVASVTVKS